MPGGSHITRTRYALGHLSWVGSLHCTDPAQHLKTAGWDIVDLGRDLSDLSDLSEV